MNVSNIKVSATSSIRDVMNTIDKGSIGIALLIDDDQRLIATITDGDIRRAVLSGLSFDEDIGRMVEQKNAFAVPKKPITATENTSKQELLNLMRQKTIHHIPILDSNERVVSIATLDELISDQTLPLQALIMAGGFGTRLRPLTNDMPKPMLPIGGVPLIERTVRQLKMYGITQINISLHYLPEKITDHLKDGDELGVKIDYIYEDEPLGTGGALDLIKDKSRPLIVMNGDLSTSINFRDMYLFHKRYDSSITVGTRYYDVKVPYGIVETEGVSVARLREKPTYRYLANAGIYIVEPHTLSHIPKNEKFNMTDLIDIMIDSDKSVSSYPISEYWLDIGQISDYEQAQKDFEAGRLTN
ncbi:MAG: nucleotidyltransferase family protein [Anaerolineae bacterium]